MIYNKLFCLSEVDTNYAYTTCVVQVVLSCLILVYDCTKIVL